MEKLPHGRLSYAQKNRPPSFDSFCEALRSSTAGTDTASWTLSGPVQIRHEIGIG
jgi:hypothetical protein